MARAAGARVEGLKETQRALQRLGVDMGDLKESMTRIGEKAAREARSNAPVRSGRLQNSIKASKTRGKATVRAGNKGYLKYATFNEFGTAKMAGTKFVTRAIVSNRGYAVQQIERDLQRIIAKNNLN